MLILTIALLAIAFVKAYAAGNAMLAFIIGLVFIMMVCIRVFQSDTRNYSSYTARNRR